MKIKTYIDYITFSPEIRTSATGLADALDCVKSHDQVTRWLTQSHFCPNDLWSEVEDKVDLKKGKLVLDDTVVPKPHSSLENSDLVQYYHQSEGFVKGINVVQMLWVDGEKVIPIDFRIVEKDSGISKNDIAQEMLKTAYQRGFRGIHVLFDSWYGANETLRLIVKLGFNYTTRFKKNRRGIVNGINVKIATIVSQSAKIVTIPGVGDVKVFVTDPDIILATSLLKSTRKQTLQRYRVRWRIEEFFRAAKQVYRLGGCQARNSNAWQTHIYASILAYARNALAGVNHYQIKRLAQQQMLGGYLAA